MKETFTSLFTALRFLTVLPVRWHSDRDQDFYKDSVKFFPLVGVIIGIGGVLLNSLFSWALPHQVTCCLLLLYLSAISGFLHLDGLTDTADGLLSYRTREKKLAIMRDSRSGAMGGIILVFLVLLKFSALTSIPSVWLPLVVLFMPIVGRCAIVLTMAVLPYARSEGGLGQLFYLGKPLKSYLSPLLVLLVIGLLFTFKLTLVALLALTIAAVPFGWWCKKALGGTTGDTLGAVCELTETSVAICFAAALS